MANPNARIVLPSLGGSGAVPAPQFQFNFAAAAPPGPGAAPAAPSFNFLGSTGSTSAAPAPAFNFSIAPPPQVQQLQSQAQPPPPAVVRKPSVQFAVGSPPPSAVTHSSSDPALRALVSSASAQALPFGSPSGGGAMTIPGVPAATFGNPVPASASDATAAAAVPKKSALKSSLKSYSSADAPAAPTAAAAAAAAETRPSRGIKFSGDHDDDQIDLVSTAVPSAPAASQRIAAFASDPATLPVAPAVRIGFAEPPPQVQAPPQPTVATTISFAPAPVPAQATFAFGAPAFAVAALPPPSMPMPMPTQQEQWQQAQLLQQQQLQQQQWQQQQQQLQEQQQQQWQQQQLALQQQQQQQQQWQWQQQQLLQQQQMQAQLQYAQPAAPANHVFALAPTSAPVVAAVAGSPGGGLAFGLALPAQTTQAATAIAAPPPASTPSAPGAAPNFNRVKSKRLDDFAPSADISAQLAALESKATAAPAAGVAAAAAPVTAAADAGEQKKIALNRVKSRRLDDFVPDSTINLDAVARTAAQAPAATDESRPAFMRVKSTKPPAAVTVMARADDDELLVQPSSTAAPSVGGVSSIQLAPLRQNSRSSEDGEEPNSPLMGGGAKKASSSSSSSTTTTTITVAAKATPAKSLNPNANQAGPATSIAFTFAPKKTAAATAATAAATKANDAVFVIDSATSTELTGDGDGQGGGSRVRLSTLQACWDACVADCTACVTSTWAYQRAADVWALLEGDQAWLRKAEFMGSSLLLHDAVGILPILLAFAIVTFRGIGQVVFMDSAWSGFLIWVGLIIQSPFTGLCSLWATGWATWCAYFWALPRARFEAGLYGYNGNLVGLALATFSPLMRWKSLATQTGGPLVPDHSFDSATPAASLALSDRDSGLFLLALLLTIAFFSFLSTLVQEALINTVRRTFKIPTFTLAFNLMTLAYFFGAFTFNYVPSDLSPPTAAPVAPSFSSSAPGEWDGGKFAQGAFIGVGQVFFCSHWLSSVFVLVGMFFCSKWLSFVALVSSVLGALVGLAVGAPLGQIYFGLWGYNSCLAGIAVYALIVLTPPSRHAVLAFTAAICAALLFATFKTLVVYWGTPCFTLPFCFTGFLYAALQPTFDENNRKAKKAALEAQRQSNVQAGRRASIGPQGRRASVGGLEQNVAQQFTAHRASIAPTTLSDEMKNFFKNMGPGGPVAPPPNAAALGHADAAAAATAMLRQQAPASAASASAAAPVASGQKTAAAGASSTAAGDDGAHDAGRAHRASIATGTLSPEMQAAIASLNPAAAAAAAAYQQSTR